MYDFASGNSLSFCKGQLLPKCYNGAMTWKSKKRNLQIRILLRQNRSMFLVLALWLATIYTLLLQVDHLSPNDALKIMFFFEQANSNAVAFFYQSMTDFIFFGLVVSMMMMNMQRQVRPEITSRMMAKELTGHAVVINLSNVGRRVFELFEEHHIPVAVLDSDPSKLDDLIHDGYPAVVASGRHASDLEDVNVTRAKLVFVACDDLEVTPVICSLVRQMNSTCTLIARCYEDEIGEVLAKRYRAQIISTSKFAAEFLNGYAKRQPVQHCVMVGCGQLGRRMIPILEALNIKFVFLVDSPDHVEDLVDEHTFLFGPSHDKDLLAAAGVGQSQLVILTEDSLETALTTADRVRQLNSGCRIICRVFHDDAADMLSSAPFNCDVISTSRYTIDKLRSEGAFQVVGLPPDTKKDRRIRALKDDRSHQPPAPSVEEKASETRLMAAASESKPE